MEDGAGGRLVLKTPVGMPARAEVTRGLIRLAAQFQNMRAALHRFDEGIKPEGADLEGECLKRVVAEGLVRKPDDSVVGPCLPDSGKRCGRKWRGDIETCDFRAEARRIRTHMNGIGSDCRLAHGVPRLFLQPSGTPLIVMRCMSRSWP